MKMRRRLLSDRWLDAYRSGLNVALERELAQIQFETWTPERFKFATAVSVMSSSRIEGESLEVDSYIKHKTLDVAYSQHLTERPNDLYRAYEFASDHRLTEANFLKAHAIATEHLLAPQHQGVVRSGEMLIVDPHSQRIQYEAASAQIVQREHRQLWMEIEELLNASLSTTEAFYYASLIHLVFVKIHPFNDGNGRVGRLLEKWFLADSTSRKAWFVPSEMHYFQNLEDYYHSLARVGLFYEALDFDRCLPFLAMLPGAVERRRGGGQSWVEGESDLV